MLERTPKGIDRLQLKRLAAEAGVDERSLLKRLGGKPVRGFAGARCDEVLQRHGLAYRPSATEPPDER